MEIRRLGDQGLAVSTLGLGTLTWGGDTDDHEAAELLATYLDAGGNTLDVPSDWGSPTFAGRVEAVGRTINDGSHRNQLVIIVHSGNLPEPTGPLNPPPPPSLGPRCSKRNLLASLDNALHDLRTDHVDLWVIHGPRQGVTIAEIQGAAHFALATGRATYVGVAGLDEWDCGTITAGGSAVSGVSALAGAFSLLNAALLTPIISHGEESGLGFVALSPLAQGALVGKYRHSTPPDSRAATGHLSSLVSPYLSERHGRVVEAVYRAARSLDSTPAKVALAWVLDQPGVSTAIVGPRGPRQLDQLLAGPPVILQRELRDVLSEVAITD